MKGNRIHMSTNRIRVRTARLLAATALVVPATLLSQDARTVADSLVHAADVAAYQSKPYEAIAAYERAIALTTQEPERRFLERRICELSN